MDANQTAWLPPRVFMAKAAEDLVILQVDADQYHCLADAAPLVELNNRTVRAPVALIEALVDAGLARREAADGAVAALPPPATRSTGLGDARRGSVGDVLAFWRTERRARRLLQAPPLTQFLAFPGPAAAGDIDPERVARLTAGFAHWLPWTPRQGVCLYRAAFLLRLLRQAGQDATWVFGVRTWPFAAHCWLQVDDLVLDDTVERVRSFAPVMAV